MNTMKTRFITVDRMRYAIHEGVKYGISISSIHPYDETEYHWAFRRHTDIYWHVYRNGKNVRNLAPNSGATPLTLEEVARELERLDQEAHLHRTGGIW